LNAARRPIGIDVHQDRAAARAGLDRAIRHFLRQGRAVRLARPPAGIKDVNDLLRGASWRAVLDQQDARIADHVHRRV